MMNVMGRGTPTKRFLSALKGVRCIEIKANEYICNFTAVSCKPGTFSKNGLEPCMQCDRRSYQSHSEAKACIMCPGTTVTLLPGSNSSLDCLGKYK